MSEIPEEVRELAHRRADARAARDFANADALRDRIAELGFSVTDGPEGAVLEPIAASVEALPDRVAAAQVASVLDEPATVDVALHWVVEGWPEDVVRAISAFRERSAGRTLQFVVAVTDERTDASAFDDDVEVLLLEPATGWASARNAGLRRSRGRIVVALDGSVEPTGEVLGPLDAALADPAVGVCGPFGISTADLREFVESAGPDVDAIEGYCMALRRELLGEIGLFDERFRWYRTADIEYSFRAKDAGYRCVVVEVPVRRHVHRMWEATTPEDRERLSKRNFYRFLERFRGRTDLLVDPGAG